MGTSGARPTRAPDLATEESRCARLVCDDERGVRWVLNRLLTRELNWTVVECEDGQEALNVLNHDAFDLLLLDLRMPVLNGMDTLKAIRATPTLADLRVVVLTSCSRNRDRARASRVGGQRLHCQAEHSQCPGGETEAFFRREPASPSCEN